MYLWNSIGDLHICVWSFPWLWYSCAFAGDIICEWESCNDAGSYDDDDVGQSAYTQLDRDDKNHHYSTLDHKLSFN